MKLITSINQVDPALAEHDFWSLEKLQAVDEIYAMAKDKKAVNQKFLNKLNTSIARRIDGLTGKKVSKPTLTTGQKIAINDVLEHLQQHGWRVAFYPLPIKKLRPSALPNEAADLIVWRSVEAWRRWFWEKRVGELERNEATLALVIELSASLGVNRHAFKRAMRELDETSAHHGKIAIPVLDDLEPSVPALELPLNGRFRLLWAWYLSNTPDPVTNWRAQIKQLPQLLSTLPLDEEWRSLPKSRRKRSTPRFLRSGSFSLVDKGIEPFIATALHADILPLSPPDTAQSFGFYPTHKPWPQLIKRSRPVNQSKLPEVAESELAVKVAPNDDLPLPPEPTKLLPDDVFVIDGEMIEQVAWLSVCQQLTKRLQGELRKTCVDPSGHFQNRKLNAQIVDELLAPIRSTCYELLNWHINELSEKDKHKHSLRKFVSQIEQRFSGLDLMIAWVRHRLVDQRISVQTLSQDLRLVFIRGLFWYEASANLSCWDDEDVEILISDHLLPSNKTPGAQRRAINLLKRVADWSRDHHNCFEGVFFPSTSAKGVRLTWRNHIIGLQEHDFLQRQIKLSDKELCDKVKAVLDLAFYGGMRSGEIANLRLGNIVVGDKELVLYLPAFKTPSAYRSIHFHLLAPPAAVQRVKRVLELREIEYRRYANKMKGSASIVSRRQALLFSMKGNIEDASSTDLVAYAREIMKHWLGDGADLHLARHSFASHLLLRWYCSRHPDLIKQLREQKHFLFSPQGLRNLRTLFGESVDLEQANYEAASLVHLIKIIGHKTTHTLFSVYVHSFEVIANHALQRIHEEDKSIVPTGKAIAALLSNKNQAQHMQNCPVDQ